MLKKLLFVLLALLVASGPGALAIAGTDGGTKVIAEVEGLR